MGCLGYCSIAVERHQEDTYKTEYLIGDLLKGIHMCLRVSPAYIIPLPVSNYWGTYYMLSPIGTVCPEDGAKHVLFLELLPHQDS